MEVIRGKQSREIDGAQLRCCITSYKQVVFDLGTGDGCFVRKSAIQQADTFFIGVDSCRENLHTNSRLGTTNTLFVIANAQALPPELHGLASSIHINFPWGSLLTGLLEGEERTLQGLSAISQPKAKLQVLLNGEALFTTGWMIESGTHQLTTVLQHHGWLNVRHNLLTKESLRTIPTTWAKRLAVGRDPRTIRLCLQKNE